MFTHPNAAAFPYQSEEVEENGLTKRELIAALIYANANPASKGNYAPLAKNSLDAADALIAVLNGDASSVAIATIED